MQNKKHFITCDKCGKDFEVNKIKPEILQVKFRAINADIYYFVCPKCLTVFPITIIDELGNKYIEQLKNLSRKFLALKGSGEELKLAKLIDSMDRKQRQIKNNTEKLKTIFDGEFIAKKVGGEIQVQFFSKK